MILDNKIIGIINGDLYGRKYQNVLDNTKDGPKNVEEKKNILYGALNPQNLDIIRKNNGMSSVQLREGIEYGSAFNKAESYTVSEIEKAISSIKEAQQTGKQVYFWDTETLGLGENMSKAFGEKYSRTSEASELFAVTEMYMAGVNLENGEVKNVNEVIKFTSGIDNDKRKLIENIQNKINPSKTELSILQRLAGYSGESSFNDDGYAMNFDESADYTNRKLVESGMNNLSEVNNSRFARGMNTNDPEYLMTVKKNKDKEINNIYNKLAELVNNDSVIIGANTDSFDINVLKDLFMSAQIPEEEINDLFERGNFIDVQKIIKQLGSTDLYKEMDEKGMKADLKISSLIELFNGVDEGNHHVAEVDTIDTAKITAKLQYLFDDFDNKVKESKKFESSSDTILFSNRSIKSNSPYDFKVMNGEANTYSNYITTKSTAYKIDFTYVDNQLYEIEKNKYIDGKYTKNKDIAIKSKVLSDGVDDISNKMVAILTDIDNEENKTFMFLNNESELQDLIDRGDISLFEDTEDIRDMINRNNKNIEIENRRNLMSSFSDPSKSKTAGFNKLEELFNGYKIEKEFGSDSSEFKEFFSIDGSPKLERIRDYNSIKDELKNNEEYYETIINTINQYVDGSNIKHSNSSDYEINEIKKNIKTKIFSDVNKNFEDDLFNNASEKDIMNYLSSKDEKISLNVKKAINEEKLKEHRELVKKGFVDRTINLNEFEINEATSDKIIKSEIEKYFNINLSDKDEKLKNLLFDKRKINDSYNSLQTIDILAPDGDYTSISLKSKETFENGFQNNIYKKITGDSKPHKEFNRRKYMNEVIEDLHSRGILDRNEAISITGKTDGQNIQSAIDILSDTINNKMNSVFETVNEINGISKDSASLREKAIIALELNDINYENMKDGQNEILSLVDKFKVKDVFYDSSSRTFMGQNISEKINDKDIFKNNINEMVREYSNTYTPIFVNSHYANNSNSYVEQLDSLKEYFTSEDGLNWSDEQVEYFTNKIINKKEYRNNVSQSKRGKNILSSIGDNGATTIFIENAEKKNAFMVIAEKEKTNFILNNQKDIEKIKEKAFVFELPRIDRFGDIEYIDQGEDSVKVITQNIKSEKVNKQTGARKYRNTTSFESMIDKLSSSMYSVAERMEGGEYAVASSIANRSMKEIYERKPMNGFSLRPVFNDEGKAMIVNTMGINIGDYNLRNARNITDISKSIDFILDENTETGLALKKKFLNDVPNPMDKIEKLKDIKTTFKELDDPTKLFFTSNLQDIAKSLLENNKFMSENEDITELLEQTALTGSMYTKDSGDAAGGMFNSISPLHYNPDSLYSAVTRPLDNQTQQANVFYANDSLNWFKFNYNDAENKFGTIKNKDWLNILDVKESHGSFTESKVIADRYARSLNKEQSFGLTTSVSKMTSENFIKRSTSLKENEDVINDIINSLNKKNVNVSKDEVFNIVDSILNVSNLYEDSGIMSPLLAASLQAKTVKTIKVDSDIAKDIVYSKYVGNKITKDNDLGKLIGYKDRDALVVGYNEKSNKLRIQMNHDYRDTKFAFATDEKAVMHTPVAKTLDEAIAIDEVMKRITGGANLAYNPGYAKHEAFTAVINPYKNAILNNIKNDTDMGSINSMLENKFKNHKMEINFDNNSNRYIFVSKDAPTGEINIFEEYQNLFDEIKNKKDENKLFGNIAKSFEEVETVTGNDITSKANKMYMDLFLAKDNTIENVQGELNVGKGATATYRGSMATGLFFSSNDIERSRKIGDKSFEKLFDDVIKNRQGLIFDIPNNNDKLKQASNIYQSLIKTFVDNSYGGDIYGSNSSLNIQPKHVKELQNSNFVVEKMSLEEALRGRSGISASDMPAIFKSDAVNKNGQRINAYEIDLTELKAKVKSPMARIKQSNKISIYDPKDYVDKITIPAMSPNITTDGIGYFADSQKKAADFLDMLYKVEIGEIKGMSVSDIEKRLPKSYENFVMSMMNEIVDKNGLLKQGMSGKIPFSSRNKVGKISSPVVDKNGLLIDPGFKNLIHKGGDTSKAFNVAKIGLSGFTDRGLDIANVGRQLLTENLDSSELALSITNELRNKVKDVTDEKILDEILYSYGEKYLKEVGIAGMISRDPVMLSTSEMATRILLDTTITGDTVAIDSATAKMLKADGDGDEINIFLNDMLYKDSRDNIKIRNIDSEQYKSFDVKLNVQSEINATIMNNLIESNLEHAELNSNIHRLDDYKKYVEDLRGLDFISNPNYTAHESTSIAGQMSRIMKGEIGYISNPNYYIKNAATAYYSNGMSISDLNEFKTINEFLDATEQKLIDTKSVKKTSQAVGLSQLASGYASNFDAIANTRISDADKVNNIKDLYLDIGKLGIVDSKMGDKVTEEYALEVAERILSGKYSSEDKLEESLGIITKILSNDTATKAYFSPFTRQSLIFKNSDGKYMDIIDQMSYIISKNNSDTHNDISYVLSNAFLQDTVFVNDKENLRAVNLNDTLKIKGNKYIDDGYYNVDSIQRKEREFSIKMTNVLDGDDTKVLSADNFIDLSSKIKDNSTIIDDKSNIIDNAMKDYKITLQNEMLDYDKFYKNKKAFESIKDKETELLTNKEIKIKDVFNGLGNDGINAMEDAHMTINELKNQKYVNNDEAGDMLKKINESIKKKGTKEYRDYKKQIILNSNLNIQLNERGYDAFMNEKIYPNFGKSILNKELENDITKMSNLRRYDTNAKINDIINNKEIMAGIDISNLSDRSQNDINTIKTMFIDMFNEKFNNIDSENLEKINEIIERNQFNSKFLSESLNINIGTLDDNIMIPYGKYTGFTINELSDDALRNILKEESSLENKEIIKHVNSVIENILDEDRMNGKIRTSSPNLEGFDISDIKDKISNEDVLKDINDDIRKKGAERAKKPNGFAKADMKKMAKETGGLGGSGKGLLIGAGIVAAMAGASYIAGKDFTANKKLLSTENDANKENSEYKKNKNNNNYSNNRKQVSFQNNQYIEDEGANYEISALSKEFKNAKHPAQLISSVASRGISSVSSYVTDDRRDFESHEINDMIVNCDF